MEKTRKLGQTEIEITAIGYGCMGQTHAYGVVEAEEDMVALMRYAHEVGYTFFDTAPVYGEANERYLGKAVAPFRKEAVIATKFGIVDESFFTGNEDALNNGRADKSRENPGMGCFFCTGGIYPESTQCMQHFRNRKYVFLCSKTG